MSEFVSIALSPRLQGELRSKPDIAMIGDRDSILGFKALGVSIFPAENREKVTSAFKTTVDEEYKIVFITDDVMPEQEEIAMRLRDKDFPVVIPIPSNKGSTGLGTERLRGLVRKAAGADILSEE